MSSNGKVKVPTPKELAELEEGHGSIAPETAGENFDDIPPFSPHNEVKYVDRTPELMEKNKELTAVNHSMIEQVEKLKGLLESSRDEISTLKTEKFELENLRDSLTAQVKVFGDKLKSNNDLSLNESHQSDMTAGKFPVANKNNMSLSRPSEKDQGIVELVKLKQGLNILNTCRKIGIAPNKVQITALKGEYGNELFDKQYNAFSIRINKIMAQAAANVSLLDNHRLNSSLAFGHIPETVVAFHGANYENHEGGVMNPLNYDTTLTGYDPTNKEKPTGKRKGEKNEPEQDKKKNKEE